MVFSSIPFLYYFLPAVLLLYLAAPKKGKNAVLFLSGLAFYAWGEGKLVLVFVGTILFHWALGLAIERKRRRIFLMIAILSDLALLGYFKYADFFPESFHALLGTSLPLLGVALPIGVSFYTFQLMSYTVDIRRGDAAAQKSLMDFGAYIAMFPQLIAGPIVRYTEVQGALTSRTHSIDRLTEGLRRFLFGLGKKVLLANVLGELCAAIGDRTALSGWLYAAAFSLQIYFDFSGYSDMAIGLGKLFGFDFPENFDYPYISRSITEFWRRWHITLGRWFRDYVYIPLGGNRRGLPRQLMNIAIVWMLTGLWHGAAWNFVLWGLWFAVLLSAEKLGLGKPLERRPLLGHIYVILAVLFGFVLFDAGSLSEVRVTLGSLFGKYGTSSPWAEYLLRSYALTLAAAMLGATPIPKKLVQRFGWLQKLEIPALGAILVLATAYLVDGSFNPFLYFRF